MQYDTFISYNSKNVEEARYIYEILSGSSISVFFDKAVLKPGDFWQKEIEKAIDQSQSIIIIVGSNGTGPWQEYESYLFQLMTKANPYPKKIIPLLLPNSVIPNIEEVPAFIHGYQSVTFKHDLRNEKEKLLELSQAIPQTKNINHVEVFERPILRDEEDTLLNNTIFWYDHNAEFFREKWKDNLPVGPLEMFLAKVREDKRNTSLKILDVGCGPGHHANYLAQKGLEVTGLDLSRANIDIAKKEGYKNCTFIHGDMRNLQHIINKRNVYDGIWACGSCLHLPRERLARQIYEFIAVLKPGSILALSLQVGIPSKVEDEGRFFERYDETELETILKKMGLRIGTTISEVSTSNTVGKPMVKKWVNLIMKTPSEKEFLPAR